MKRIVFLTTVLLIISTQAFAEDKKKQFILLAKGNTWNYDTVEQGKKSKMKWKVTEGLSENKAKIKSTEKDGTKEEVMTWKLEGGFLVWETVPGMWWRVLKFDAKKGDSWKTTITAPSGPIEGQQVIMESKILAVEDLLTPAGKFKNCLKIEHIPKGAPREGKIITWWAEGVGLLRMDMISKEVIEIGCVLTSFKVGPGISDEKLKEMVEKAEAIALVTVPKEAVSQKAAKVDILGAYKGDLKVQDGKIEIAKPEKYTKIEGFAESDFVVFLKKEGEKYNLLYSPAWAGTEMLGRMAKLITIPKPGPEKLKELAGRAGIVAGLEIVKLEERGSYNYYVAKVISALKGCEEGKHLDILHLTGMNLEKGKKYVLFLHETEVSDRKMTRVVDVFSAVLAHDETTLKELFKILEGR